jgi:hypothetical protein
MADDWGNLADQSSNHLMSLAANYGPQAYAAYKGYKRVQPFIQGGIDASQGAMVGADVVKAVGWGLARSAATTGAEVAGGAAVGAAEGAAAGSVVPGVGTAIGAVAGAVAPLVIPHIPVVGKAVSKIPVLGGILSPQHANAKPKMITEEGGSYRTNPFVQSGNEYAANQRAEYNAGRGFRH